MNTTTEPIHEEQPQTDQKNRSHLQSVERHLKNNTTERIQEEKHQNLQNLLMKTITEKINRVQHRKNEDSYLENVHQLQQTNDDGAFKESKKKKKITTKKCTQSNA